MDRFYEYELRKRNANVSLAVMLEVLSRASILLRAWIPACAGMTKVGNSGTMQFLHRPDVVVFFLTISLSLFSCGKTEKTYTAGQQKIKVITTLFPLYDMARGIGGDKVEVSLLLPPGMEPHSFEPNPRDIVRINEADIFVYTGRFMEPWAERIIKGHANGNLVIVDASRRVKMIPPLFHSEDAPAGAPDPHIWLDFDNAKTMAGNIAEAFQSKDGNNRNFYRMTADQYNSKLSVLDSAYKAGLSTCRSKELIYAGHYAFGYLARRYGLKYLAAQGVSPDAEPTVRDLVELVRQIKAAGIKYVFYEELTSPKIAETLAGETGARMLLLNAAHNLPKDQFDRGLTFFDILYRDLENLKTGLECS